MLAGAALVAAAMPSLVALAATRAPRLLGRPRGLAVVLALVALALVALVRARWVTDFRFVLWRAVEVVAALALAALGIALVLARPRAPSPRRVALGLAVVAALGAGGVAAFAARESTRKAAAQAGLAGPLLALGRSALDADGDGYARFLGGPTATTTTGRSTRAPWTGPTTASIRIATGRRGAWRPSRPRPRSRCRTRCRAI